MRTLLSEVELSDGTMVDAEYWLQDGETVVVKSVSKDGKKLCMSTLDALGILKDIIESLELINN